MLMDAVNRSYYLVPPLAQSAVWQTVIDAFASSPSGVSERQWRTLCSQIMAIQISKDKDNSDYIARFFGGDDEPYHIYINGRMVSSLRIVEMNRGYTTMWQ